ncbi:MAG: hypothetical protein R2699_06690 [Acidimicrobiales bacterium]|nr:hypothetical protein [Acidimicrobiales bacterium]
MTAPVPSPLAGRQRRLVVALQVVFAVAVAASIGALVLPGRAGDVAGGVMVAVLVGAPALRIGWLVQRWLRRGDRRFAAAAIALLGVLVVAVVT